MTEIMILRATEPETAHALLKKTTSFLTAYAEAIKRTGGKRTAHRGARRRSALAGDVPGVRRGLSCGRLSPPFRMRILPSFCTTAEMPRAVSWNPCSQVERRRCISGTRSIFPLSCLRSRGSAADGKPGSRGVLKNGSPEKVYEETLRLLQATEPWRNYVLSTGATFPPA